MFRAKASLGGWLGVLGRFVEPVLTPPWLESVGYHPSSLVQ